ncbi:PTS sugar transporter subunit IIC [Erysipelothrix sp. D19-032]
MAISQRWLLTGLNVAGGMLPAIGFAMILSVMVKKELVPFVLMGYVLLAYFKLPVIGIALFATIFALQQYNQASNKSVLCRLIRR